MIFWLVINGEVNLTIYHGVNLGVFNPDIGSVSLWFFSVFGISVSKI